MRILGDKTIEKDAGRLAVILSEDTTDYTDYGGTSTITGWSTPLTTTRVWYFKKGRMVVVHFGFAGTSNATTASFTLPYYKDTYSGSPAAQNAVRVRDNGTWGVGLAAISPGGNTVNIYPTMAGSTVGWTNSGTKETYGMLVYFTD
jgi:hypothetical protein